MTLKIRKATDKPVVDTEAQADLLSSMVLPVVLPTASRLRDSTVHLRVRATLPKDLPRASMAHLLRAKATLPKVKDTHLKVRDIRLKVNKVVHHKEDPVDTLVSLNTVHPRKEAVTRCDELGLLVGPKRSRIPASRMPVMNWLSILNNAHSTERHIRLNQL